MAAAMLWTQPLLASSAIEGGDKDRQKEMAAPQAQPDLGDMPDAASLVATATSAPTEAPATGLTGNTVSDQELTPAASHVIKKSPTKVKPMKVLRETRTNNGGSTFGALALVFGLLGFLLGFLFWPLGLLFAVMAIVFGAVGVSGGRSGKGMAIAGMILGILTLLIPVLIIALLIAFLL